MKGRKTFERLLQLCAAKRIVCERVKYNRIELTTPCGGTSAICGAVKTKGGARV